MVCALRKGGRSEEKEQTRAEDNGRDSWVGKLEMDLETADSWGINHEVKFRAEKIQMRTHRFA